MVWVEDTRSVQLNSFQKEELLEVMGANPDVAENSNLMTVAIEFRLKPLLATKNDAGRRNTEGESKAFKQLK